MDQARKLREMMESMNMNTDNKDNFKEEENLVEEKLAKIITVSSGKGGVGKTNFSLNLSITLAKKGYKVAVLDADIGLGNIEILSGTSVSGTISDIINKDKDIMEILSEGPEGVKIISGGSGLKELTLTNEYNMLRIIGELNKLQRVFDYIVIDTGAGISNAVLDFALASSDTIVVSTPDPTSIMDAYVLIKSLNIKGYTGKIKLVTNMVENEREALDTYKRINMVASEFLKMDIDYLGYVNKDEIIVKSIRNQVPFTVGYPNKKVSLQMAEIARKLIEKENVEEIEVSFTKKLINFFLSEHNKLTRD